MSDWTVDLIYAELAKLPHVRADEPYLTETVKLVRRIGKDHELALQLWETGRHTAREMALRIMEPGLADNRLLEAWVKDLDRWDITDSFCGYLVCFTPHAKRKVSQWAKRKPEFQRRAAFALLANMTLKKAGSSDEDLLELMPLIEEYAADDRYYVKKAVNWALRNLGKRNYNLRPYAQTLAQKLQASEDKTARWVGSHRMKEIGLGPK